MKKTSVLFLILFLTIMGVCFIQCGKSQKYKAVSDGHTKLQVIEAVKAEEEQDLILIPKDSDDAVVSVHFQLNDPELMKYSEVVLECADIQYDHMTAKPIAVSIQDCHYVSYYVIPDSINLPTFKMSAFPVIFLKPVTSAEMDSAFHANHHVPVIGSVYYDDVQCKALLDKKVLRYLKISRHKGGIETRGLLGMVTGMRLKLPSLDTLSEEDPHPSYDDEEDNFELYPCDEFPVPAGGMDAIHKNLVTPDIDDNESQSWFVVLGVKIGADGRIFKIKISSVSPFQLPCPDPYVQAAVDAVKSVDWVPGKLEGRNVTSWVLVPVDFD